MDFKKILTFSFDDGITQDIRRGEKVVIIGFFPDAAKDRILESFPCAWDIRIVSPDKVEQELGKDGRILVRASGTENLIRVMIKGLDKEDITKKANDVAFVIKKKYGMKK